MHPIIMINQPSYLEADQQLLKRIAIKTVKRTHFSKASANADLNVSKI